MSVTQFPRSRHPKRDLLNQNLDRIDTHAYIMGCAFWFCCAIVLIPLAITAACGT